MRRRQWSIILAGALIAGAIATAQEEHAKPPIRGGCGGFRQAVWFR